jgi:hypothetical protein
MICFADCCLPDERALLGPRQVLAKSGNLTYVRPMPPFLVRLLLISVAVFALSAGVSSAFASTAQAQGPFSGIEADPDQDGVLYPNDACPGHAGPAEGVGCPLEDLDGDGLSSNQDLCPTVAGPEEGCPRPGERPSRDRDAESADDIAAGAMSIDRRGGLSLEGWFSPRPAGTAFTPRTLTVWLPKQVSLLAGSVKGCSKAHARALTDGDGRCTQFAGGLLPQDENLRAWFAFAGPKRGDKRLVWLRARLAHDREDDSYFTGFATGWIEQASGLYGTKLVLKVGGLGIHSPAFPFGIDRLRATGPCPRAGWPFRVQLHAGEGTATRTGRLRCS